MADLWHYTSEGKRMEPVTAGELRQLADAGFLRPEDLVWKQEMTDWVAASSIPALFAKAAAAAFTPAPVAEADDPPVTFEVAAPARSRRRDIDDAEDEPRSRRRRRTEDDSPRRRRSQQARGPSLALLLGLGGGGIFVLLLVVIAIVVAVSRGGSNIANYTMAIPGNGTDIRDFTFKANTAYEFLLTSTPVSDVDIYLTDLNGQTLRSGNLAAADNTIGPNGRIVWIFSVPGVHRVKVQNLGPPLNTSTVNIRELGPGHAIEVPPMLAINNPQLNMPVPFPARPPIQHRTMLPPPGPVGPALGLADGRQQRKLPRLGGGQECEFTVAFPAAKQVTVEVRTIEQDPDVDLFVFEVGSPRVFSDVTFGADCNLAFQAQAGRSYRFVIRNVSHAASIANSTITYTSP